MSRLQAGDRVTFLDLSQEKSPKTKATRILPIYCVSYISFFWRSALHYMLRGTSLLLTNAPSNPQSNQAGSKQ
jgi:hypothetical protein